MKKLLYIILLLPLWATAQTNGTIQKTSATGTIRGSFGSLGLDTLPRVTGALVDGYILKYHAATNKWYASPDPTLVGLQDSLTKKANRTFDNVASGAIAKAKVDTSANGLLPKSNLFPLGDTRYVKKSGDTMTGTLNGTDIVLSDNIKATGLNSTGQATLGSLNQGGKMNFVSGGTGAVGGTLGFSTNATTNIMSLQNIQGLELTSTNSNGYVAVRATGANGSINFRTGSNINGYVHPSGNWSFQNGGTYTDNGYRIDVNGTGRFTSALTANSFVKSGGTSAQFLMGNGTVQDTTQIQTVSNFFPKGDTRYVTLGTTQSIPGAKTFTNTIMATINTADAVISNFANTSATGFGSKIRGGFGSRYSFLVTDYNDASLLNISQGVGATFALRLKSPDFDWVRQSNFGYSSDYKTQIIGATSGNQTIAFGVDPVSNVGGSFSGNGSEYMFRNAGKFITPNSGNTDYNTLLSWNSSGGVLLPTLSGSGDVIAGADNTGLFGKITIGSGLSLTSGVLTATGGSSGSVTTSGLTSGRISKATSASNIENSIMTEAGTDISIAGSLTTTLGVDVKTNGGLRLWNAGNSGFGTLGYDGTNITSANSISGTTFTMSGRSNSMGLDVMTNSGFRLYNAANSGYAELAFNGTLITSTHGFSAPSATYSGTISASNFSGSSSGTNTGDQTTITGNAGTATALQTTRTIGTLTGDVTSAGSSFDGTGNNTNATTLATVNANVGTFGSSTSIPTFTVNGKGLITAASGNAVVAPAGTLTGATLAANVTASSLTSAAGGAFGTNAYTSTAYAPLASPALTGNPTAPTQTASDNSTKIATTAYVDRLGGGTVTSGTYTPTITGVSNLASSSAVKCHYIRVGNEVTITGRFTISSTTSSNIVLRISLPIASNLSATGDLSGSGSTMASSVGVYVIEDTTNDEAEFQIATNSTTFVNVGTGFTLSYTVK